MNHLLIIFTLFDPSTARYLELFDLSLKDSLQPKAISFDRCFNDFHMVHPDHSNHICDIILVHEEEFSLRSEDQLKRIIEKMEDDGRVYLTLHQSNRNNIDLHNRILNIAGNKLVLPINSESHTIDGKAFNMLIRLGQARSANDPDEYIKQYQTYLDSFILDIRLEAKLELMHSCADPFEAADLLAGFPIKSQIDTELLRLVQQAKLSPLIQKLTAQHLKEDFFSHYEALQKELFD